MRFEVPSRSRLFSLVGKDFPSDFGFGSCSREDNVEKRARERERVMS